MTIKNPLFLIGAQRSGTTIFSLLLAEHKDTFIAVNGKLLYYLITWLYPWSQPIINGHIRLDEVVHSLKRKRILGISESHLEKMYQVLETQFNYQTYDTLETPEIIAHIWVKTFRAISNGEPVIGEKYNEYLIQLDEIRQIFPRARYIFIYRHYLDTAESMFRVFRNRSWGPLNYENAIIKWARWNEQWLKFKRTNPNTPFFEVKYEDLVKSPTQLVTHVCDFLGLPTDDDYLEQVQKKIMVKQHHSGLAEKIDFNYIQERVPNFSKIIRQLGYNSIE